MKIYYRGSLTDIYCTYFIGTYIIIGVQAIIEALKAITDRSPKLVDRISHVDAIYLTITPVDAFLVVKRYNLSIRVKNIGNKYDILYVLVYIANT